MKLLWILVLLPITAFADQISYQEHSRITNSDFYYTSADRGIQYNRGDDDYWFLSYRKTGICPYYCDYNHDTYGIGLGKYHNVGPFRVYAQAGYYVVDNTFGDRKVSESLEYYFNAKFGSIYRTERFRSYTVDTSNTLGASVGIDIPYNDNFGIGISYKYLKIKEVLTARIIDPRKDTRYWLEPVNRDLSTLSMKIYYDF